MAVNEQEVLTFFVVARRPIPQWFRLKTDTKIQVRNLQLSFVNLI